MRERRQSLLRLTVGQRAQPAPRTPWANSNNLLSAASHPSPDPLHHSSGAWQEYETVPFATRCGVAAARRGSNGIPSDPLRRYVSAAAAGASAALADVAGAGGTHLRATGHADRCVGRDAAELLEQLGRAVDVRGRLTGRGGAGAGLDLGGVELTLGGLVGLRLGLPGDGGRLLE